MERKTIVIIAVVVAVLLCICCLVSAFVVVPALGGLASVLQDTPFADLVSGDLAAAGDEFMQALADENFQRAYNLMHPDLQYEVGSADQFGFDLQDAVFSVTDWSYNSTEITNDYGELQGRVTDIDGEYWDLYLAFLKEGGRWLLVEYNFDYQG